MMDPIEKFHAHLDLCDQCRDNPFDLCLAGATLLQAATVGLPPSPTGRIPTYPRFQNVEPRTETGKAIRDALAATTIGPILKAMDFDYSTLELEMLHEFEPGHAKDKKGCPACAAGIFSSGKP